MIVFLSVDLVIITIPVIILQRKRVHPKRVVEVENDMMQKFMSPYERYTAYMEVKPFLEGGKRRKDTEASDLERVSRVSQKSAAVSLLPLVIIHCASLRFLSILGLIGRGKPPQTDER